MKYKTFAGITVLFGALGLALALSGFVRLWPLELLASYMPQLVLLLLAVSALFVLVLVRSKRLHHSRFQELATAFCCLVALCCLAFSLLVQHPLKPVAAADKATITVGELNKLHSNTDYQLIADYMLLKHVDVFALEEAAPDQVAAIQKLTGYKYSAASGVVDGTNSTTVAVVSRWPLTQAATTQLGGGYAVLRVKVVASHQTPLAFYSLHFTPPFTDAKYAHGNAELAQLQEMVQREKLPVVVAGDFNKTVFSPALRDFRAATHKQLQTTETTPWPACSWYGASPLLCMRIDHIYIPAGSQLVQTAISPDVGSDHHAVVATFVP